ncbi:N-acetyl-gamma-glutamyl-phosphate reductase [Gilvimarinus sp. SDUM040013]|uniref:N-acetyl-gamma-glutamyl-phosphate reductase n=1 Tax=Gilvimarinus gilvus TaxID=3058038 RepID=A0ABU4RTZ1_9GAMM|nr:N-acetyl-gamma-glutamyl-phosphate reductase [Gilvimarinus sp. SDUM040013]MDO3386716.1 N-acetyl-gamma-glutamyl-phosphate reductase [Gilvimarinus sp. SDUM040013]MDX6848354.1 N-acetyl-gamma-glutamyl-phosphate reductase [Gilvimarinus sp. SDUM040013]
MINVGIVGGTGYTGVELLRLLCKHPQAKVSVITSRAEAGIPVSDLYPNLRGHVDLCFSEPDVEALGKCDVVFFATPHGVAQNLMPALMATGTRVIDLSADFRIRDAELWAHWYDQAHGCPELISEAVYGLPENNRAAIKSARLVACPGCYPTAAQLGLLPLLENELVDPTGLIISAASGASGAGRQAKVGMLLTENSGSFKAYGVSGHRHLPEIEQALHDAQPAAAVPAAVTFVPHLLPMVRGIHVTSYARALNPDTLPDLQRVFEERYVDEPFVDVLPEGQVPETRSVKGSNMCRISVCQPQGRDTIVILSVIDNLTKGASGQAIQNMNIMFGFEESAGLDVVALLP